MDRELNQAIRKACGIRIRDEFDLIACWFKLLFNYEVITRLSKNELYVSETHDNPGTRYYRNGKMISEIIGGKADDRMHVNIVTKHLYAGILGELYRGPCQNENS
jgi:hypothetical protein